MQFKRKKIVEPNVVDGHEVYSNDVDPLITEEIDHIKYEREQSAVEEYYLETYFEGTQLKSFQTIPTEPY